jgi:hypothetical protein
MKTLTLVLLTWCVAAGMLAAEDEPKTLAEKIVDISPDGKFGMRLKFDQELNEKMIANESNSDPGSHGVHSHTIEEIALVAVATGEVLAKLMPEDEFGTFFNGVSLLWSSDSKWFAYSYAHPRFSYTTVYRRDGEKFRLLADTQKLLRKHKGDVRNEYLNPEKWIQPGVLQLTQEAVLRGGEGDGYSSNFTVAFTLSGKFKVIATDNRKKDK